MGKSIGQQNPGGANERGPPHDYDHASAESTGIAVDWKGFFASSHLTFRNYGGEEAAPPPHREGKQSGGWQRRLPNCELRGEPRSLSVWNYGGGEQRYPLTPSTRSATWKGRRIVGGGSAAVRTANYGGSRALIPSGTTGGGQRHPLTPSTRSATWKGRGD